MLIAGQTGHFLSPLQQHLVEKFNTQQFTSVFRRRNTALRTVKSTFWTEKTDGSGDESKKHLRKLEKTSLNRGGGLRYYLPRMLHNLWPGKELTGENDLKDPHMGRVVQGHTWLILPTKEFRTEEAFWKRGEKSSRTKKKESRVSPSAL